MNKGFFLSSFFNEVRLALISQYVSAVERATWGNLP